MNENEDFIDGEIDPEMIEMQSASNALALVEPGAMRIGAPNYTEMMMPALSVDQSLARYQALQDLVKGLLQEGTDYGQIPGTQGKSLWLRGAETIAANFGLQVSVNLQDKDVDRSAPTPYFEYRYKATIYKGGHVIATCDGSCNNYEDCFKVWVEVPPPSKERQAELIAGKAGKWDSYGGAEKWKEKRDNPNPFGLINNIQKRAQKRAYVGAIEKAVGASGLFAKAAASPASSWGRSNSAGKPTASQGEADATLFWSKVKASKVSQAAAKQIAQQAIDGAITWAVAIEQLATEKAAA
jgi:hypothetical protein